MTLGRDDDQVGVYVHVPFCDRVCPYCDFAVVAARGGPKPEAEARYVDALVAELALRAPRFEGRGLACIYFGGGTPALLRPDSLARIVEAIRRAFPGGARAETTLEVNPSTVERAHLPGFRAAGVDRLSIGVQSFDDGVLKRLGRAHRAIEAEQTLVAARAAGFDDLSLDLMFAVPGQTAELLAHDLSRVTAHAPEHVSTYELVIEAGTPFAVAAARGQLAAFDPDLAADMLEALELGLGRAGLHRYELTNFARPGFESVHNRRYWARQPVLGLGVGAWSFDPPNEAQPFGARPANARALDAWLEAVESGRSGADRVDAPERAEAMAEAVFLALRTSAGLDPASFAREFGVTPRAVYSDEIAELCAQGWLEATADDVLVLSAEGRMFADAVGARFV